MQKVTTQNLVDAAKAVIDEWSIQEIAQMIHDETPIIIDVREPEEFAQGHLSAAVNVPRGLLEFKIGTLYSSQEQEFQAKSVIVYCKSGARSALAAQVLGMLGYTNVISMMGGVGAWVQAGYELSLN